MTSRGEVECCTTEGPAPDVKLKYLNIKSQLKTSLGLFYTQFLPINPFLQNRTHWTFKIQPSLTWWTQVLQGSGRGPVGLWHHQAPDLWERRAVAEGAVRPRGPSHGGHAGGEQERPGEPQDRAQRGGQGLCRSVHRRRHYPQTLEPHQLTMRSRFSVQ